MAKFMDALTDELIEWTSEQRLFFVATAPNGSTDRINLSPKGYDSLRVLNPTTVAYADLTGSGIETVAHLRQNGRITLMLCAFEGPPQIVRLYGRGEVIEAGAPEFDSLAARFPAHQGIRACIRITIDQVQTSCGFSVPRMTFVEDRETLAKYSEAKGPKGLDDYRAQRNATSIDGLPGLPLQ